MRRGRVMAMSDAEQIQQVSPALVHSIADKMGSKTQSRWDGRDVGLWQVIEQQQETINELASQVADLTDQVEELQAALDNDDYQSLTREQKKLRVKRLVQREAEKNGGRGSVNYKEIISSFNKQMPAGTAYYLMEQIGEQPGYKHDKRANALDLLKVNLSETDERFFSSE